MFIVKEREREGKEGKMPYLCFWALGVPNKTCAVVVDVVVVTAVDRPGPSAIPRVAQLSIELKSNGGAILILVFLLLVICFDHNLRSD